MGFDTNWEAIFRSRGWGRYPSEEIVRFVARRFFSVPDRTQIRVLDLGCGGGANTWFLAREGFSVTAVDGSAAAVDQTRELLRREKCTADVSVREFLDLPFPAASFDAVIDCASIQHNPWDDVVAIHRHVFRLLKPGGWLFGAILGQNSSRPSAGADGRGREVKDFRAGSLGEGVFTHLFSREELETLLVPYVAVSIDVLDRTDGNGGSRISQFIVSAQKPSA